LKRSNWSPFYGIAAALLSLLLTMGAVAQTSESDSDFQVWNETKLVIPIKFDEDENGKRTDKVSFVLMGALRLGQNRLFPVERRVGLGLDIRLNNNFSLSPSYYYRNGEELRNRRDSEHRIRTDLTYERKWNSFSLKDRNRVEYRIRHSRGDSVRYRNKLTFKVPVRKDGKELFAPFAADEVFYDFRAGEWARNEFSVGISKKLSSTASADFFYVLRNNRSGTIRTINAVGVNLKFTIR
jgi:hypothetical protein